MAGHLARYTMHMDGAEAFRRIKPRERFAQDLGAIAARLVSDGAGRLADDASFELVMSVRATRKARQR